MKTRLSCGSASLSVRVRPCPSSSWLHFSVLCAALCAAALLPFPSQAAAPRKPNIIFILADDLGYGDVGVFYQNSRTAAQPRMLTPHLDEMAAQGMIWKNHYTGAPVCSPARASLLLGQTQGHCGIRDNQFDKALPAGHTLASVLKQAGYRTACIGKWGLQGEAPAWPGHPLRHGFDEFFGFLEHVSGHTYYHDASKPLREGFGDVTDKYHDIYSTDLFSARAKELIKRQTAERPAQPFFLYLAYTAVHNPLHVPGEAYPAGAGLKGGLQWPLTATPETRDSWIHPDYAGAAWTDPMKRYATMVRRLDDGVDDLLQLLRDLGIAENTLVVFSSDNGPANEAGSDPRLFDSWGPFDGFKRDCWEGGLREPTIAWSPGRVPAGAVSDFVSGHWDWLPTFAELACLAPPAQTDGVSLVPTLTGHGVQRSRGYLYGEYFVKGKNPASDDVFRRKGVTGRGQQQMLRIGDTVAIRTQITDPGDPVRLYNVRTDPHEDHDLSTDPANAKMVARMQAMLVTARRPELSAPRPYDKEPLPAVTLRDAMAGALDYDAYEGAWSWVPDFDALTSIRTGRVYGLQLSPLTRKEHAGLKFKGCLKVPTDGEYTFSLSSDAGAHLWLHDAHVIGDDIQDDFDSHGGSASASILLKAGLHPIRVFYRHTAGEPMLKLEYSGPGIERQPVPVSAFFAGDAEPVFDVSGVRKETGGVAPHGLWKERPSPFGDRSD